MEEILRLQMHKPDCITEEGRQRPFVSPTAILKWRTFFRHNIPSQPPGTNPLDSYHYNLCANIGYRFQTLEVLVALLFQNYEILGSTIHSTVQRMLIHQYVTILDSTFEGMGAHLYRNALYYREKKINYNKPVRESDWAEAFCEFIREAKSENKQYKKDLKKEVISLNKIRGLIHMDRKHQLDFNNLDFNEQFIPAFQCMQTVLFSLPQQAFLPDNILTTPYDFRVKKCKVNEALIIV